MINKPCVRCRQTHLLRTAHGNCEECAIIPRRKHKPLDG